MSDVGPIEEDYEPDEVVPEEPSTWSSLGDEEPPIEADPVDWSDQQHPVSEDEFDEEFVEEAESEEG